MISNGETEKGKKRGKKNQQEERFKE